MVFIIWLSRDIGNKLVVTGSICVLPTLVTTINLMSVDLLVLLLRQEEAIFLLLCSVGNAALLMAVFQDARCFAAILLLVAMATGVVNDASFRTTKHIATTAVATGPTFIMIGAAAFFHKVDAGPFGYVTLHIGRMEVGVAEMVLNVNLTIAVLMFRLLYKRRALICNTKNKYVRCAVYHHKLALWKARLPQVAAVTSDVPHIQPVRAVALKDTAIDASQSLLKSWSISMRDMKMCWVWCHRLVGVVGMALSVSTCGLPSRSQIDIWSQEDTWPLRTAQTVRAFPLTGFVISLSYILPFVPSFQRQLLMMLLRNFNVVFLVSQVSLAVWCLSDMFAYDYRSWGVTAWIIWFSWVLLSDALTPRALAAFHISKRHLAAVLLCVFGCLLFSLWSLMFSSSMELHDRVVCEFILREELSLKISTAPFFMNRMFPLSAWCIRLQWDLWRSADHELIVLRGTAEYYCPMERYPTEKPGKVGRGDDCE